MRNLLEKTIVHLLNNEEEKAAAVFHKFMVEKAKQLHESIRNDENIDLGEGWDNEIKEEEYFDDDDLATDQSDEMPAGDDVGDSMDDVEDMNVVDDDGTGDDMVDDGSDVEDMGMGDDMGGDESVESKIDALTAEFDRLMGALEDSGVIDSQADDEIEGDEFGDHSDDSMDDVEDVEGEEPNMEAGDADDLADRMDSDLGDDEKPESETMESAEMDDDAELDEDLADITESVLSELDKITMPSNTDGKEIGSGGKTISGNHKSPIDSHPINDRIEGAKPYMVKGGDNDSFEREEAPARKPVTSMVSNPRKGNVRNSYKDTMSPVSKTGDGAALLNKDFAGGGEAKGRSPVDGKMKPITR